MKTLIIKLGAMGDVLRTTAILRALDGEISWLTKKESLPLLGNNQFIKNLYFNPKQLKGKAFDLVINLDDDKEGCKILDKLRYQKLIGFYMLGSKIVCTPTAKEWFAMSINGSHDKDMLKKRNKKSHQEHMFSIIGKKFKGEEYVLPIEPKQSNQTIIGLEKRTGEKWPMKKWKKYKDLGNLLKKEGYKVKYFGYRFDLKDFINDVNECSVIVTGDTLTMHIGLALKKNVITLFGPTSAPEIYSYNRLTKIVPQMDCICCYKKTRCRKKPNCMSSITAEEVHDAVKKALKVI